jgi:hypothetical protein
VRIRDLEVVDLPPTLTAAETAELFGVHVESLRALVRQGKAPVAPLRLGRALRFPTARVLAALGIEREDGSPRPASRLSTATDDNDRSQRHGNAGQ